jgi:hypothetical protein
MTHIRHRIPAAILVAAVAFGAPAVGSAQQRSINLQAEISKAYDTITKSKADHDAVAVPTKAQLNDLSKKIEVLAKKADSIPANLPAEERDRRRREIDSEFLQTQAAYVHGANTLLNEAVKMTAANISALNELGQRIEASSGGVSPAESLKARIKSQTEVGRKIADKARELREKAEKDPKDPSVAKRAESLIATATALDRSITTLKSRLNAEQRDGTADKSRIARIVDETTEKYLDAYILLEAEKSMLGDLKDEVEVALYTASLSSVDSLVGQSLGTLVPGNGEGAIPGLNNSIEIMRNRNRRMIEGPSASDSAKSRPNQALPPAPKFNNF